MKSLEIVVHCYSEEIPAYASMLAAQLSSFVFHPPKNSNLQVTIWTTETDANTWFVLDAMHKFLPHIHIRTLTKKSLFRRAIGRNISAKETEADVVWFADADYICGEGCLDAIANIDFEKLKPAEMCFPSHYMMQNSHAEGDLEIARIVPGEVFTPNLHGYFRKRLKLGIGGLQIVPKEVAHRGYLDGSKWCQPRLDEKPFPDTNDDARYRRTIHSSVGVPIPGLWRLRHSASSYESVEQRGIRMGKKHLAK